MAKVTSEELNGRINELELDDDVKISLMEDVADSIVALDTNEIDRLTEELSRVTEELSALKEKYKERFLNAVEEVAEEISEDVPEMEEKEVIDIKEI